jgi:hypothetical protein
MSGWQRAQPNPNPAPKINDPTRTFDYVQSKDNRWDIKKITSQGACFGLSIYWVIKGANGVDYLGWLGPPQAACSKGNKSPKMGAEMDGVVRVMQQQDKLLKICSGNESMLMHWARDRIAKSEKGGGSTSLVAQEALTLLQGATPKQIASEVDRLDGWSLICFWMKATGTAKGWGHAVAARVAGGAIDFFDPNLGEYHFTDKGDFEHWFEHKLIKPVYSVSGALDIGAVQHFS